MPTDLEPTVAAYLYVFAILGAAEALRRRLDYGPDFTRKLVHISVGMWVFPSLYWFTSPGWAIIPPLSFVIINYLSYRFDLFKAMESDKSSLGTVYFPISLAILILAYWDRGYVVAAGMMAMTWGDALAAIIGRRWGRHRYRLAGATKSLEGTATMFAASAAAILLTLLATSPLPAGIAAGYALGLGLLAAVVEAVSPWGTDNLTVPLLTALAAGVMLP